MSPAIKIIAAIAVAFVASSAAPAFAKTTNHQGSSHRLTEASTAYASANRGGAYADTLSSADRQGFYYRQ